MGIEHLYAFTDGASRGNPGPSAIGVLVYSSKGTLLHKLSERTGKGTNQEAEYAALIRALEVCAGRGRVKVTVSSDSEFVVRQMQGVYRVKAENIRPLHSRAKRLEQRFESVSYMHRPRTHPRQRRADALANAALDAG